MDHPQQQQQQQQHQLGYHPHPSAGGAPPYGPPGGHIPYGYHSHHQAGAPYGPLSGYGQQQPPLAGPHGGGGVPSVHAFFAPWDPPPPPIAAPLDTELQKRIAKLVEYAAKNGPQFEALMKDKQKDNPAYGFLFGGEGHDFYRFRLWVTLNQQMAGVGGGQGGVDAHMAAAYGGHGHMGPGGAAAGHYEHGQHQDYHDQMLMPGQHYPHLHGHPFDANYRRMDLQQPQLAEQQLPDHQFAQHHGGAHIGYGQVGGGAHHHVPGQHYPAANDLQGAGGYAMEGAGLGPGGLGGPARAIGLPHDVAAELVSILDNLTGTKESIKSAKSWFMQRVAYAQQLAEAMKDRVRMLDDPERQLHIVYLANDILFNSFNHRTTVMELDSVAVAFRPVLGTILATIYHSRDNSEANQERLQRIVHFWGKMEFYDRETIAGLEHEMLTGTPLMYSGAGAHPSSYSAMQGNMPPGGHGYYGAKAPLSSNQLNPSLYGGGPHHMGWGGGHMSPSQHSGPGQRLHEQDDGERQPRDDDQDRDVDDDEEHQLQLHQKRLKMHRDREAEDDYLHDEDQQSPPPGDELRSRQEVPGSMSRFGEERMRQDQHDRYPSSPEAGIVSGRYYPPPGTLPVHYGSDAASAHQHNMHASMAAAMGVGLGVFSAALTAAGVPNSQGAAPAVGGLSSGMGGMPGLNSVPQSVTTGNGERPLPFPLFPPGLIPGMVRKLQVGSGVPYSPLSPQDIPPVIPPPSVPESYVLERVRKFFAEVGEVDHLETESQVVKPEACEKEEREEEEEVEREHTEVAGIGLGMMMVDPETGTLPDGSVEMRPGMVSTGKLGLGATADPNEITQYDDVYLSYRKQRSTNYHTSLGLRAGQR